MATHNFAAIRVEFTAGPNRSPSTFTQDAFFAISLPDGVTNIPYTHVSTPDEDFDSAQTPAGFIAGLIADGEPLLDDTTVQLIEVNWIENGSGAQRSTLMAFFAREFDNGTSTEYYVRLGGAALPDFGSLAEFSGFDDQIVSASNIVSGPFSPAVGVDVTAIPGVFVTQDDFLLGDFGNDFISGGVGNDSIFSFGGDDTLQGGAGNDFLNPGDNNFGYDLVLPGTGNDTVELSDVIRGFVEIDMSELNAPITATLNSASSSFIIDKGVNGSTTVTDFSRATQADGLSLVGTSQNDVFDITSTGGFIGLRGLAGNDTFDLNTSTTAVRIDYRSNAATSGITANLVTGLVSNDGFGGQDIINASSYNGTLQLRGTDRADSILGSDADELFILQLGQDTLDAGGGMDVLRYDRSGVGDVNVNLKTGVATGTWSGTSFTHSISNVEMVRGSLSGNSTLTANDDGSVLQAYFGDDSYVAGAGADYIVYLAGHDTISGIGAGDVVDVTRTGLNATSVSAAVASAINTTEGAVVSFGSANSLTFSGLDTEDLLNLTFAPGISVGSATGNSYGFNAFAVEFETLSDGSEGDLLGIRPGVITIAVKEGATGPIFENFTNEFGDSYLQITNPQDIMLYIDGESYSLSGTEFEFFDLPWSQGGVPRETTLFGVNLYNFGLSSYIIEIAGDALPFAYDDTSAFLTFYSSLPEDAGILTDNPGLQPDVAIDLAAFGASQSVYFGDFTNSSMGGGSGSTIFGTNSSDFDLQGTANNDNIQALAGNDWVVGSLGNDTINGGADTDALLYENVNGMDGVFINNTDSTISESYRGISVTIGAQNVLKLNFETVVGADAISAIENFHGTHYYDVIYLSDFADYVFGRGGDDKIVASETAFDSVYFSPGSGDDTIIGSEWEYDLISYEDDGFDIAGAQSQGIFALFDEGLSSSGTIVDPWGDFDRFQGIEDIDGSDLGDTIEGSDIDNHFVGFGGNDVIWGWGGHDTLIGGEGDDYLNPGDNEGTNDILQPGTGDDTIEFDDGVIGYFSIEHGDLAGPITISIDGNANSGSIDKGTSGTTELVNVQAPILAGANIGGLGLGGTVQNDTFNITSADGGWMMIGGSAGNDTYNIGVSSGLIRLSYFNSGINVNLATGVVSNDGQGGADTITGPGHITELQATTSNDVIIGSANDESFILQGGTDTLDGGAGFDRLRFDRNGVSAVTVDLESGIAQGGWFGQSFTATISGIEWVRGSRQDNDQLIGDSANNRLQGMGGNDTLDGGVGGDDTLEGGDGADTFVYQGGHDVIVDYDADLDTIQLDLDTFTDAQIQTAFANAANGTTAGDVIVTFGANNSLTFKTALVEDIRQIVPSDGPFIPTAPARPPAWTVGDPHLQTLDGVGYDFHAVGEYVLLRGKAGGALDGLFEVQSRMAKVEGVAGVSVNEAVAVRLGTQIVMIDAADANPVWIDGTNTTVADGAVLSVGSHLLTRTGNDYTIFYAGANDTLENGDAQVMISVRSGRLDIAIAASDEMASAVEGLLGDGDGNAANDIARADGTVLDRPLAYEDLYGGYRDDWRVTTEAQSLFTYDQGESLAGFYDADAPGQTVSVDDFDDAAVTAAQTLVESAGLTPGTLAYDNALLDFLLTNDEEFIESSADPEVQNPAATPVAKLDPGQGRVALSITLTDAAGTPVSDARVGFVADGKTSAFLANAGATVGDYVVGLGAGAAGAVTAEKAYNPAGAQKIQVTDALNALRLSLGLDPTYGAADAFDFLQADVDQNGKVQVTDALAILRISLGLDEAPGWTFIDANADLSGVTRNAVPVFNGLDLDPLNTDTDVELVGILLGNIDNYTLA